MTFTTANILGALVYIPIAVGLGYALGYGFGDNIERLIGRVERTVLVAVIVLTVGFLAIRIIRNWRATH